MRSLSTTSRSRCVLSALLLCGAIAAADDGEAKPSSSSKIGAVISRLESPDFHTRQKATRALRKMGEEAIGPLLKRARTGRLELAVRAMSIFESAYIGDDAKAASAADVALEELAASERQDLAEHALGILSRNSRTRTRIAIQHLRRMGAETYNYNEEDGGKKLSLNQPQLGGRQTDTYLVIDATWKGGVDGLKYVRRLAGTDFNIYFIDGAGVPEKAITELEAAFETNVIARRGSGMLGIKGARAGNGCVVSEVVKGKAADKSGVRQWDVILEMDGKPVADFEQLVEMLRMKKVDDVIKLKISRETLGGGPQMLSVKLGRWKPPVSKPGQEVPLRRPAPKP